MAVLFYSTQDPAAVHAANALRNLRSNSKTKLRGFDAWRFEGRGNGNNTDENSSREGNGGNAENEGHPDIRNGGNIFPVSFDLVELPFRYLSFQDADMFGADLAVFLSRHAGASGRPCFTCHLTGNFCEPKEGFGGSPRTLSRASAHWLKRFFLALEKTTGNVSLEATHHGPTLSTPCLFVETGSDEAEWNKPENGVLLAESVLAALEREDTGKAALGFGGTHYCSAFAPLLKQGWALSHVASKHSIEEVSLELIKQAVDKTVEPIERVFLDKKGCTSDQRKNVTGFCETLGLVLEPV